MGRQGGIVPYGGGHSLISLVPTCLPPQKKKKKTTKNHKEQTKKQKHKRDKRIV